MLPRDVSTNAAAAALTARPGLADGQGLVAGGGASGAQVSVFSSISAMAPGADMALNSVTVPASSSPLPASLAIAQRLLARQPGLAAALPRIRLRPYRWLRPKGPQLRDQFQDMQRDLAASATGAPGWDASAWHISQNPWQAPRFAGRHAPVAWVLSAPSGVEKPCLSAAALARGGAVGAFLREARVGGSAGLPDPGAAALPHLPRQALLVVDPCHQAYAAQAAAMLEEARAQNTGRPILVAADPAAGPHARPTLPLDLPVGLAPWTLLDFAAELHLCQGSLGHGLGWLSFVANIPLYMHGISTLTEQPGEAWPTAEGFARLVAASHAIDPFRQRAAALEDALRQLADWRRVQQENARIQVCVGMQKWKRARIAAAFASAEGAPRFVDSTEAALAALAEPTAARSLLGRPAIAVWATRMPEGLPARAAAAGAGLLRVEDGFIRSSGLGAGFLPGASLVADSAGPYYDPRQPSGLETLLGSWDFTPELLARAATLRQQLVSRGVTKYNLAGEAPVITAPAGRRILLVPGQVEDDAAVMTTIAGPRSNLALLQAVRAAEPEAFILFKPHPDVEAGYRKGRVPERDALRYADQVLAGAPMAPLYGQVHGVHTISSQSGFEALLRGLPVTAWGQPFYAGWGLTDDRNPPPRRGRALSLDALVAGVLMLYPRYVDPVTELPCPVELLLDRLEDPTAWRRSWLARARQLQGRAMAVIARFQRNGPAKAGSPGVGMSGRGT